MLNIRKEERSQVNVILASTLRHLKKKENLIQIKQNDIVKIRKELGNRKNSREKHCETIFFLKIA